MRRRRAVLLLVILSVLTVTVPAFAQAPAPKVTITGFVDNISTWYRNMSMPDGSLDRTGDKEWYARTRVRPDIVAEVGRTKFVLGLEIDETWGQTGAADTNVLTSCTTTPCTNGPQRFGESGGWDLNTDTIGVIEVKWAYTEFDLPLVPWATRVRLGAQPFATTYKVGSLATGDFAGAHLVSTIAPNLKFNLTYGQLEEESTGPRDSFVRGEDFTVITSLEVTPFKGLDIRPTYSYLSINGPTSLIARQNRGGLSGTAFPRGNYEDRHTLGIDARWKSGPFSLEPTVFYQFGTREVTVGSVKDEQDMSAWFVDVRGGWQAGPLLVEGAVIYTTGNSAREDVRDPNRTVNYYQVTDADASYYFGWAEIVGINIDYNTALFYNAGGVYPPSINMGNSIGYDKYGLFRLGARASYAVTPTFAVRGAATANWTAEDVDTRGTYSGASGIAPSANPRGRDSYLGTEVDLGFQYRFAPNVALDVVGAYLFAGQAFARADAPRPADVQLVSARVRYSF